MDGSKYKLGYLGSQETIKIQKYVLLLLAAANLVLIFNLAGQRDRLVIVPPVVNERMELGYDSANEPYYKSYALYVASFLGNINPANATFVKEGLSLSFTPELYADMQAKITEDAQKMRVSGRTLRFYADRVIFEPATGKTFVTGKREVVSPAGNISDQDVCYEMRVAIRDGLPKIENYNFYQGAPRTEDWLLRNRHTQRTASATGN